MRRVWRVQRLQVYSLIDPIGLNWRNENARHAKFGTGSPLDDRPLNVGGVCIGVLFGAFIEGSRFACRMKERVCTAGGRSRRCNRLIIVVSREL